MKNISLLLMLLFLTSAATSQNLISSKIDSEFHTYQNTHNSVLDHSNASNNTHDTFEDQAPYMETNFRDTRWEHDISFRYRGYFVEYYNANMIALEYTPMYNFSKIFSCGVGIGLGSSFNREDAFFAMPLFFTFKFKFSRGDFTPYFATSLGVLAEVVDGGTNTVCTFSPKFGIQDNNINITVGYEMILSDVSLSGFSISIGAII